MNFEYDEPAKFTIDKLQFYYHGEIFKGSGFLQWSPVKGFTIDALLDKTFAPVDALRTAGQIFINTSKDTFPIRLLVRGHGRAIVPIAFPLGQKQTFQPDNHLSMDLERVVFFNRLPNSYLPISEHWAGSAVFTTKRKLEFPDLYNLKSTLGGVAYSDELSTGLCYDEKENWDLMGRSPSETKFELSWSLRKRVWTSSLLI